MDNDELVLKLCGMDCRELTGPGGPGLELCGQVIECKNGSVDISKHCPVSCGMQGKTNRNQSHNFQHIFSF